MPNDRHFHCIGTNPPATMSEMYIIKRDGRKESVHFDKITSRISKLCYGLNPKVRSFGFCFRRVEKIWRLMN